MSAPKFMESTTLEPMLFPVRKVEFTPTFGMETNRDYSHAIIGTIDGKDRILNVCSDRYELIPNTEIFPTIREQLKKNNVEFSESYRSYQDARFYAQYFLLNNDFSVMSGNDVIRPRLEVQHSYNGLVKYAMLFGFFRLVCSNGMVIPVKETEDVNFATIGKHTEKINLNFKLLQSAINNFLASKNTFKLIYEQLADRWIENWVDRLETVMNATKISVGKGLKNGGNSNTVLNEITAIIRNEANKLTEGKVNDWLIYNGINNYIGKDDNNDKTPDLRRDIDKRVITYILNN